MGSGWQTGDRQIMGAFQEGRLNSDPGTTADSLPPFRWSPATLPSTYIGRHHLSFPQGSRQDLVARMVPGRSAGSRSSARGASGALHWFRPLGRNRRRGRARKPGHTRWLSPTARVGDYGQALSPPSSALTCLDWPRLNSDVTKLPTALASRGEDGNQT